MKRLIACVSALTVFAAMSAHAAWPERPVTVICPWSAGGGTDATARMLAKGLEDEFGQPFNVVNRTGGGGMVGHMAIANANPDGYTIGTVTIEIAMYRHQGLGQIDYNSLSQIALYNADAVGVHVSAKSPYTTAADVFDAAKANPGKLKASGAGRGGIAHMAFAGLVQKMTGSADTIPWVPSEGAAPALQQLVSGAIDVVSTTLAETKTLREAGKVNTLAVVANDRNPYFPDIPSMPEALGIRYAPTAFRGVSGPAGMPDEIVQKLSTALKKITSSPTFVAFMEKRGFNISYLDAEDYQKFVVETDATMKEALKAAGVTK